MYKRQGDNKVNASEDGHVVVSGSSSGLEAGRTVTVTLADSSSTVSTTATVLSSGAWVAESADISALTDGNITVTANASDTAGNAASAATKTITLDNAAPTITIATTLEGDNIVNIAEDATVVISGTTANVEDSQTVTVTFTDGTTTISKTASVSSDAFALTGGQIADITNLNDGPITVTASVSDAHGNAAVAAVRTITLDNLAPQVSIDATLEIDNIVNSAEEGSVVVTGTSAGAVGRTVTVTADDSNGGTTCLLYTSPSPRD
mgnify:FL=1